MAAGSIGITNNLRVIRNARHFWFRLGFVFTVQWIRLGGSVAHTLIGRYKHRIIWRSNECHMRVF